MQRHEHLIVDPLLPVVFLDIDGVLNGGWQHEFYRGRRVTNMEWFNRGDWVCSSKKRDLMELLLTHEAQVIIVSSWSRDCLPAEHPSIQSLELFLAGPKLLGSLVTGGGPERGQAVIDMVTDLRLDQWVVIDDAAQLYLCHDAFPPGRLINCNGRYGISERQMEELHVILTTGRPLAVHEESLETQLYHLVPSW